MENTVPAPTGKPVIIRPDGGIELCAFGDTIAVALGSNDTRGSLSLWVNITPPGGGPPPHYHLNEDELFLVQKGRVQFMVDGEWTEPGEGSIVYVPRGNIHAFRNAGDTPSRMWIMTTPAGFERFFARCAAEFACDGGPDMQRIIRISAEHGIHYVGDGTGRG